MKRPTWYSLTWNLRLTWEHFFSIGNFWSILWAVTLSEFSISVLLTEWVRINKFLTFCGSALVFSHSCWRSPKLILLDTSSSADDSSTNCYLCFKSCIIMRYITNNECIPAYNNICMDNVAIMLICTCYRWWSVAHESHEIFRSFVDPRKDEGSDRRHSIFCEICACKHFYKKIFYNVDT